MQSYLLDTCAISAWADERDRDHQAILDCLRAVNPSILVSLVTVGEVEYGIHCNPGLNPATVDAMQKALGTYRVLIPTRETARTYARLRAWLFRNKSPKDGRKIRSATQFGAPDTDADLKIQENDLWIASQAAENNLVLVTRDKMTIVQEAVAGCDERLQILRY